VLRKLALDFAGVRRTCVGMPTDRPSDYETIALLCVRAGMIMEDVTAAAVMTPPKAIAGLRKHLGTLSSASADVAALIKAAEVLARRS
jgi:hypothetical protein